MQKYTVFFDFDNTITAYDVFDDMVLRFSEDDRWAELERQWKEGRIGSRECLKGQIEGVAITKRALDKYLAGVKLDPYFKKLIKLLDSKKNKIVVLSDNFDYILKAILKNNGIGNLKIYSNKVKICGTRLAPYFPLADKDCLVCGHCKRNSLLANNGGGSTTVYIGDGLSDVCPSEYTDMVFAKEDLSKELKKRRIPHIAYRGLKDVYKYFK